MVGGGGGGGGGRFLVKRREGGVVDTPMNTMVSILNEKLECGYTSDIFAFTALCSMVQLTHASTTTFLNFNYTSL